MKKILEKHIGYWLRHVSNHVSLSFAHRLALYDINVAEWVVLNVLSDQSQPPTAIAKMIGMTKGATSKVLNKLFNKQLIDRVASSSDRRYQEISLTEKGKKILPKLRAIADENDDHFFGHLSNEEKSKILKFFMEIIERNKWKDIPIN